MLSSGSLQDLNLTKTLIFLMKGGTSYVRMSLKRNLPFTFPEKQVSANAIYGNTTSDDVITHYLHPPFWGYSISLMNCTEHFD